MLLRTRFAASAAPTCPMYI